MKLELEVEAADQATRVQLICAGRWFTLLAACSPANPLLELVWDWLHGTSAIPSTQMRLAEMETICGLCLCCIQTLTHHTWLT